MKRNRSGALALVAAGLAISVACGGGGGGGSTAPAAPSTPAAPIGGAAATVRITADGVSPKEVRIDIGGRVMFVNENTRSHEMLSDPHPVHTGCPEMNAVGDLNPGQSRMTGSFGTARRCGFHDNRQDSVEALRGTIVIGGGGNDPGPGY